MFFLETFTDVYNYKFPTQRINNMMLGTQLFYAFFYSTRDDVTHIPQIILYLFDHEKKVFSENRFVFIYIVKHIIGNA